MSKKITISEIAPRDGWQNIQEYIPLETKRELVEKMLQAGVRRLQIGSFVSPKAIPQMRETGVLTEQILSAHPDAEIFALVPNMYGAKAAVAAGLKEITCVISVSESHNKANVNRTVEESFAQLREIREAFPELRIHLDAATAFGCPFEGETPLDKLLEYLGSAVEAGVDGFDLCDTVGVAYPTQMEGFITAVKNAFPTMPLEVHIHDTRNMGILNTWTAIQCGVDSVQSALGGLGGCPFAPGASGNTSTEDLVYMLHKSGYETGIDFDALLSAAKYMRSVVNGNYSGHHINIGSKPCLNN